MKKYIVNGKPVKAKSVLDAVKKVKDGAILVRIVNRDGKLIETKRFPNREKLDNYVNSLENFYDMTKEKELYKNKYNESDVQDVWTVVISDSKKVKDANPLVQEVANAIKGINEIFGYKMQKALENQGFDVSYDESSNLGYILYAKKNGKKVAIISKNKADPDANDIVQGNFVIGLMDSKTCKDAWVNEETKNFFTGGDKPNFDKARKLSKSLTSEFWMARSSGVFLGEKDSIDKLAKLLSENNIPFDRLELNKLIVKDSKTCKDESTKEKLIKLWAYTYGQSVTEAKKHIDGMTPEEIERKYKVLSQGQNSNAKKAFYEDSAIKDAEFKKGDKVKISNDFHIYSLRGAEGIVEYIDEYINVNFTTGPEKGETHPYTPKSLVKVNDSAIRDAYYNIGGYKSKDDKMLKEDIAKAKSYGLTTYLEWVDGSYQLTVEGSYDKVKKIVEDYFGLDVSSIGDSKCKDTTISYKGYDIEFNFYGKNEYTVQYQGDDIWFKTIDEAKKFIDEITLKKDSIDEGEFTIEINGEIYEDQFGNPYHFNSYEKAMNFIKEHELKGAKVTRQYGKADSKSCKDMPYNGTSQVKEINKGYAIVLRSRWEKYGVNAGIETWEPSLDGAKAHKDSLTRADGLAFVIIDCNTKKVIDSNCKDESPEELVKRYQKRVDNAIESFGRIGGALYDELDDNGLYVKEENGKYIVKKKVQDSNCKDDNILGRKVIIRPRDVRMDKYVDEKGVIYSYEGTNYDDIVEVKLDNGEYVEVKFDEIKFLDSITKDGSCKDESMFMILNKDEGCYLYNVDILAATYSLTNNANKADKFTLSEANRIINILKKYNFDNLTTSEFLDSKCKDVNPNEGESKEDFIARFMSETKEEYPDEKQRYAVANSYWERRKLKDEQTIKVTLDGKTYNAIYYGKSTRYPDMADVYIDELLNYYDARKNPKDDLGRTPNDGKYYISINRIKKENPGIKL